MLKILGALCALLMTFAVQAQDTGTLKKIRDSKTITLGYRADQPPFSFTGPDGQPAGYSVDLCKRVQASVERALGAGPIAIKWVAVTSANRFDQVVNGTVDLECGNTTITLGRMERVDFSNMIFIDGGAVLTLAESKLMRLSDLAGKTVGVKPGTTTETSLKAAFKDRLIDARVVNVKDDTEALAALNEKRIDGYAADRIALAGQVIRTRSDVRYTLIQDDFSIEPYGLMLRRDPAFRLAVNRAISQTYRSGAIAEIFDRWLGPLGKPGPLLSAMFYLNTTPE
ncbi:MAG TPA: amino acid ABC transporter substrate-binding protein [Burkholderiaceae bacterium]|nr:amino acid ABC transporter substrate-binding protein [Burkholderiaceae bacterium]HQR70392.1 amino acid ABC transporter substrate-binding protein [Burkholderiaceae bacterium]